MPHFPVLNGEEYQRMSGVGTQNMPVLQCREMSFYICLILPFGSWYCELPQLQEYRTGTDQGIESYQNAGISLAQILGRHTHHFEGGMLSEPGYIEL